MTSVIRESVSRGGIANEQELMRSSFILNDCRLQAGITDWETAGREDERLERRADDRCSDGGMDNGKTDHNK